MHGQFVWYELTTPDVDASLKFYPRATGWGTQRFDKDYTMWTTNGAPFAGIFKLSPEMKAQGVPPSWMPYIESDDVDATLLKVASLGGAVVMGPGDIPGTGRFGVARDPQGATFGVYKSIHPSNSWNGTPVVGRFSWHELMTTDYKKAAEFYGTLFGWGENGTMDMGGGEMYSMFGHGEAMYGGMFNRMADMGAVPPNWLIYVHVKDVAKAVKAATKGGATVLRPQMDIPGGTIAVLADPQGAAFAVHDLKPTAQAAASAEKPAAVKSAAKEVVGKARKAVTAAKAAVGKTLKKAAKAVKGAVKKAKAKVAPKKAKAKAKAAKPIAKAKAAVKQLKGGVKRMKGGVKRMKGGVKRAKPAARKVVAKTRSKAKVVRKALRRRAASKRRL